MAHFGFKTRGLMKTVYIAFYKHRDTNYVEL